MSYVWLKPKAWNFVIPFYHSVFYTITLDFTIRVSGIQYYWILLFQTFSKLEVNGILAIALCILEALTKF